VIAVKLEYSGSHLSYAYEMEAEIARPPQKSIRLRSPPLPEFIAAVDSEQSRESQSPSGGPAASFARYPRPQQLCAG
jgi:hypothetical protein